MCQARIVVCTLQKIGIVPITANPPKGGDAKPWVYRHALRDHDCQVTEDEPRGSTQQVWMLATQEFDMASRLQFVQIKNQFVAFAMLGVLACTFMFPAQAFAYYDPKSLPSLPNFIENVANGNPDTLRGIYVEGVMAYPIIQQPMGYPGYVSEEAATVTQFSIASEVGNIGLLAHNFLAGADFSLLEPGDTIILIYGDGHTQGFLVSEIQKYQALKPLSPYSDFRDLESDSRLTAEQLFNQVYRGEFHLTLQTCIENEGNESWGRLFIIAVPISEKLLNDLRMVSYPV